MDRYDLRELTMENPPCRRCRVAERRVREAYDRGYSDGVRAEHERWEALREAEGYARIVARMRATKRRDTQILRAGCLLTAIGALLLVLMIGGYR